MKIRPVLVVASVLAVAPVACDGEPEEPSDVEAPTPADGPELDPPPQQQPDPDPEVEPPLLAYGTPAIEEAEVIRQGRRVRIRLKWSKVDGAARYQVQVAKTLTFSRPIVDRETPKLRLGRGRLDPAIYFWRVRALGDAGEGAFTGVQVLDATQTGRLASRARRRIERRTADGDAAAIASVATKTGKKKQPLRLVWREPEHRAVVTKNPIQVKGVATRGTRIKLGDAEPVEVVSTFAISVPLKHGRNDLVLVGQLGDQSKTLRRSVWYADPSKLAPIRERFEAVRAQLTEIGAIRDELEDTVRTLESRIAKAKSTEAMEELKSEMARIRQIKREIDKEINTAISELDQLLGG